MAIFCVWFAEEECVACGRAKRMAHTLLIMDCEPEKQEKITDVKIIED